MIGFINKQINSKQMWGDKILDFDPDASPQAWEHYKKYYTYYPFNKYFIEAPRFFTHYKNFHGQDRQYNRDLPYDYINCPIRYGNRLYSPARKIDEKDKPIKINGTMWYRPVSRLCGETDFNFNKYNFPQYAIYIEMEADEKKRREYLKKLEKCKEMHHTLVNFSLMQTMGNLQGFKKQICDERVDRFVFYIDKYYTTHNKNSTEIIRFAGRNGEELKYFLDKFEDIYDYCNKVYFVNEELVCKFKDNAKYPIDSPESAMKYIDFANEFWRQKELRFQ